MSGLRDNQDAGGDEIIRAFDMASGNDPAATSARPGDAVASLRQPSPRGFSVEQLNAEWAMVLMGSKAVMMHERADAPIEDRMRVLSIDAFRAWYLNRTTELPSADGKIKAVTWATAWLGSYDRRQYSGIEFAPMGSAGQDQASTPGYYNLWRGFSVAPLKALPAREVSRESGAVGADEGGPSYSIFKDHLLTNVCAGRVDLFEWVFGWFAHIIQSPRERVGTALVLRGCMGCGKTKVGEVFGSLIAAHYFMVDDPRYVTGQFNAHMASCLLLQAEEAVWAGDKAAEGRLKGLVTSKFQMIEQKGIDPIRIDNFVRLIMTSNEDWVVPAGKDERRFCVLDVAPHVAQNHEYFSSMDAELKAGGLQLLLADLMDLDISKLNLRAIPKTGALLEQKIRSLDSVDGWWFERLCAGTPTRDGEGWPLWISSRRLFDDYIADADRTGIKRRAYESEMGKKLLKIMPLMVRTRGHDPSGTPSRPWGYQIPSLAEARASFSEAMGQTLAWAEEERIDYAEDEL